MFIISGLFPDSGFGDVNLLKKVILYEINILLLHVCDTRTVLLT